MAEQSKSLEIVDGQNKVSVEATKKASSDLDEAVSVYRNIAIHEYQDNGHRDVAISPFNSDRRNDPQPLSSLTRAVDDYREAVAASKRFFEDNRTELHELATQEGQAREEAERIEAENRAPHHEVDLVHSKKMAEIKSLQDRFRDAPGSFPPPGDSTADYYGYYIPRSIRNQEQDLENYYKEHQVEVQENAQDIMEKDLKERDKHEGQ